MKPNAPRRSNNKKNWKKDMPAKNKIATTTAHIIAVEPKSGWDNIKNETSPSNNKGFTKPLNVLISFILRTQ